jgi:RNA polymerase sigma factor for flagellar operon FliA
MKEIAEVVGIAISRVSQIRQATMVKLKKHLAHLQPRPAAKSPAMKEAFGYA